jgi:hypothetical protein
MPASTQVSSGVQAELDTIRSTPAWDQSDNSQRLDFINQYEDKLFQKTEAEYDGGWNQYMLDNPLTMNYMDDLRRESYTAVQADIDNKRDRWLKDALTLNGKASPIESMFVHFSSGLWSHLGNMASAFGNKELAKDMDDNAELIRSGYNQAFNELAFRANELDKNGLPIANEILAYAQGFLPFLQPDDRELLLDIAEQEGLIDENGKMKPRFWESTTIFNMLGHFGRTMTIMHLLPGAGAAAGSAAKHALRYAVAAGMSQGLALPVSQQSIKQTALTMGGTFAALLTGGTLSQWFARNPLFGKMIASLPARAQFFIQGRVADIGESLANAVELGVRTGDIWNTVKGFPVALMANMFEEVLIDLPGLKGGKASLEIGYMHKINQMQRAVEKKKDLLQNKLKALTGSNLTQEQQAKRKTKWNQQIKDLDNLTDLHQQMYNKRQKAYIDTVKKNKDYVAHVMDVQKDTYTAQYKDNIAQGMTKLEAQEDAFAAAATAELYKIGNTDELNDEGMMKETMKQIEKAVDNGKNQKLYDIEAREFQEPLIIEGEVVRPEHEFLLEPEIQAPVLDELQAFHNQLPEGVKSSFRFVGTTKIEFDLSEADLDYEIQRIKETTGKLVTRDDLVAKGVIDASDLIKVVYGAPISVAHHEIFHWAQRTVLSNDDMRVMYAQVGGREAQARAFSDFMRHQQADTKIGQMFVKVKDFFESIRNWFAGRGFTNVNQIFTRVASGDVTLAKQTQELNAAYATEVRKGFLSPEGNKHVITSHAQDYPDAQKNNWVKVSRSIHGERFYKSVELTDQNIQLIQDDLDTLSPEHQDMPIAISDKSNQWIISLDEYHNNNHDLRKSLNNATYKLDRGVEYAIEEKTDYENAVEQGSTKNIHKEIGAWGWKKALRKIPGFKNAFVRFSKTKQDMHFMATMFELPFFAAKRWPVVRNMLDAQYAREKRRAELTVELLEEGSPYFNELDAKGRTNVNAALVRMDQQLGEYSSVESAMKGLNLSETEAHAYLSVRKMLNLVIDKEITVVNDRLNQVVARLDNLVEIGGDTALIDRFRQDINDLQLTIDKMEAEKGKGYLPHVWRGDNHITFWRSPEADNKRLDEAVKIIAKTQGDENVWMNKLSDIEPVFFRFAFKDANSYEAAQRQLAELGVEFSTERAGNNETFEEASRASIDAFMREVVKNAQRKNPDTDLDNAVDLLNAEANIMFLSTGWAKHSLGRTGTLGYETQNLADVLKNYVTGYAGIATKRDAAVLFNEAIQNIDPKQKNLMKYSMNLMKQMLHNQDKIDTVTNWVTSAIFAKALGFNLAFHIRNRMQPYYMGAPVLAAALMKEGEKFGLKEQAQAAAAIFKAGKDLPLFARKISAIAAEDINEATVKDIGLPIEEIKALAKAVDLGMISGTISSEMLDKIKSDEKGNGFGNTFSKGYGWYIDKVSKFVSMSDHKNRMQVFLAAYRLFQSDNLNDEGIDEDAVNRALAVSQEANVVYKSWNTMPVFWAGQAARPAKFLFQFQKFGWHSARLQFEFLTKGKYGPLLQMYAITMLLGGASTLPFWETIKNWFVPETTAKKMRQGIVDALGGERALVDFFDYGIAGLLGMDGSRNLQIRPLSLADPMFGENAVMSQWRDLKYTVDDFARGRVVKGVFEGVWAPGWLKKISRAGRTAVEGMTTFRGDMQLDVNGKPLTLNSYELMLYGAGIMPKRIGRHFVATNSAQDLISYYGKEKSNLGTKFKIATIKNDREMLRELKREIDLFNKELDEFKINGKTPAPKITSRTLKAWKRGTGSQKMRDIARRYYPVE